jgi:hypothetical protein
MVAAPLFFVFFADKITVSSPNHFYPLPTFKFAVNGTYLFIFNEVVPETLQLVIFNESRYFSVRFSLDTFPCADPGQPNVTEDTNINGTINTSGIYYPHLFSCKRGIFCQADVALYNPTTFLDLRLVPAITVGLLAWLFWLLGTSFWLLNVFMNLSRRKKMNLFVVPGGAAWLLGHLFRYVELKVLESSDVASGLNAASEVFATGGYICFATCLILATWGLSVIDDDLPAQTGAMAIIASAAFVLAMFNLITWDIGDTFLQVVVAATALAFYARQMCIAAGHASDLIKSQAEGVPTSFHRIYSLALGAVVYFFVCVLIGVMIAADPWVVEMLQAIGEAAFGVAFASVYYIRKVREGGYSGMASARSDDVQDILMADLSEIQPGQEEKIADQPLMEAADLAPLKRND